MGEVVLAQRDQDAVVRTAEVEVVETRLVAFEPGLEGPRRAVFHQIGEVLHELGGTPAAGLVALGEGEDLLELVEDEQREQRAAGGVAQEIVAVVEELPKALPAVRHARARPMPRRAGGADDGLLDLLRRRRGVGPVVDADVHRAVTLGPESRHDARAEDGGLAESRLAEEHGEETALHPPGELAHLLLAAVEVVAGLLGERGETEPGVARVDRVSVGGGRVVHARRALHRSCRRAANSGEISPPGSRVKWTALNRSGTSAAASVVSSMQMGRMKTAPSAMLRVRSTA